jgi:hypothetical protein
MKKIVLFAVAAMLVGVFQANAQLGVKLGYNFAKLSGVDYGTADEKFNNNFAFGAFYEKDLIPLLDLRLGLDFSPKGNKVEAGDDEYKMTVNYLEIPIQAKVKLGPIYALGGVYGAYALGGKNEATVGGVSVSEDIDFDDQELKRLDFGMKFGLGFQLKLGPVGVFAQGEYSFGLQNINDGEGDAVKNKVISASIGALIGF